METLTKPLAHPLIDPEALSPAPWQVWLERAMMWSRFDWAILDWTALDRASEGGPWPGWHPSARDDEHTPPTWTWGAGRSLTMHSYREERPGTRWQELLRAVWPAYRRWYLSLGEAARPTLAECEQALRTHLPELLPAWEQLCDAAAPVVGRDADLASRLLSGWCVPAFGGGCSQVAIPGAEPVLLRNYDYDPALFEGVVASTRYGKHAVIGTSDMLWGLLDGVNDAGLAVSLTLGGRPGSGPGFAIPIVVRALLETCTTVAEAVERVSRIPVAQAYNLTFVDRSGSHATVFVAPGEPAEVSDLRVATNHRLRTVEHPVLAGRLGSQPRQERLLAVLGDAGTGCGGESRCREQLRDAMLEAPVRTTAYDRGFGTLYTAELRPGDGSVVYHWPGRSWTRRFTDPDDTITVELPDGPAQPAPDRAPLRASA